MHNIAKPIILLLSHSFSLSKILLQNSKFFIPDKQQKKGNFFN